MAKIIEEKDFPKLESFEDVKDFLKNLKGLENLDCSLKKGQLHFTFDFKELEEFENFKPFEVFVKGRVIEENNIWNKKDLTKYFTFVFDERNFIKIKGVEVDFKIKEIGLVGTCLTSSLKLLKGIYENLLEDLKEYLPN